MSFVYYYLNILYVIVKNFMHCFSTFVEHLSDHHFEFLVGILCISDLLRLSSEDLFCCFAWDILPRVLIFLDCVIICTLKKTI